MTSEPLFYAAFAAGLVLPMLPGLLELRARKDAKALQIDEKYTRDPRYLGKAFREKIRPVLALEPLPKRVLFLDRAYECARLVPSFQAMDREYISDAVLSSGPVVIGKNVQLRDVYGKANVQIGAGSRLRTLAAKGPALLSEGVRVERWVDVEDDLDVGDGAHLGRSASTCAVLKTGVNVTFNRLFGNPVCIGTPAASAQRPYRPARWSVTASRTLVKGSRRVRATAPHDGDIVATGDVLVEEGAVVNGSIKCDRSVKIMPHACVLGNVIARGNIEIGAGASILGHVFVAGNVRCDTNASIGSKEESKTLYASGDMRLAMGCTIYGWAICEGTGMTGAGSS
jgi:predicted acyltransferase (DUF342 family)